MNQPQTEKYKAPFTYNHENLAFMLPKLMVVTPSEQVRKLEAVKIQLEEALKRFTNPHVTIHGALVIGPEDVTAAKLALAASEELNND